ncbi:Serine hydrolase [Halomicronema hongdechloris C2206]|uniref:Serine hydrolase n=1 Tax=Halomicronema hongdechloris C2206 TaxID=1641165 RepID=A0A1Z3HTF8_9CYAN|nr:serine hydrolase [Halomicronema hongdechloris]ASC73593.1 Serine hydrolase [Halomicronema hongdechloris C2206]
MVILFLSALLFGGLLWLPLPPLSFPLVAPAMAQANITTPSEALARLFTQPLLQAEWFSPSFLRQISLAQMESVIGQLTETLGAFQGVEAAADHWVVVFDGGRVTTRLALDQQGRIQGLVFEPPDQPISPAEMVQAMQAFPGEAHLLIRADGQVLASHDAEQPLAVGSAFKLAVLAALSQEINAGNLAWEQVVSLQSQWRSLPSGLLQDWPASTALTVETLAAMMISLSDNTATDALIDLVGRKAIEALSPGNRPFLTTREFFALKHPANAELLQRYRQGDEAQRRALLPLVNQAPLPSKDLFEGAPLALDVEWFFPATKLCDLMEPVADLPLMGINPGVAKPDEWAAIAYKGGSEPGVLNLTTALTDRSGRRLCVTATWNRTDQPLEDMQLIGLYRNLLAGLRQ